MSGKNPLDSEKLIKKENCFLITTANLFRIKGEISIDL
jgi:hypothetical protein